MWKRFKDWLIKKLGGYTKAEYDKEKLHAPLQFKAARAECVPVVAERFVIRARMDAYGPEYSDPYSEIKECLVQEIQQQIPAYIEFDYLVRLDQRCIRARLLVMKREAP